MSMDRKRQVRWLSTLWAIWLPAATVSMLVGAVSVPMDGQSSEYVEEDATEARQAGSLDTISASGIGGSEDLHADANASGADSGGSRIERTPVLKSDFNQDIYYKNKLEISLESGWLPINVPFVWDFLVDSAYTTNPLPYTMEPNILSLRWQHGNVRGHTWLRGNWDHAFSFTYTDVARGPETRYFAFDYGFRRNFVQPRWRIAPYFEMRGGAGDINAKGYKVTWGQGQNFTFTYMMGAGARFNFNPKWSISGGLNYMHVSNFYLSEPRLEDYGINVYGPMVGVYMRLGGPRSSTR